MKLVTSCTPGLSGALKKKEEWGDGDAKGDKNLKPVNVLKKYMGQASVFFHTKVEADCEMFVIGAS